MNLTLGADIMAAMIAHARAVYPQEACGFLAGRERLATRFIPLENALASETAYEIQPAELASTFRSMREAGEELVAIVHSHPRGAAKPSRTDMERAFYPEAAHVIISLADPVQPQVRAFYIRGGEALEIELHAIV